MSKSKKLISSIPKEAWEAAIEVIRQLLYPITATTAGVGKLIEQKLSTLNSVQRIFAEQTLREATEKAKRRVKQDFSRVIVKPQVIYIVLENADGQSDDSMRELWANLTARELTEGSVHPEIARVFGKLTSADLIVLSQHFAEESSTTKFLLKVLASAYSFGLVSDEKSFNHTYLLELGLLKEVAGKWMCTTKGKELIRCLGELEGSPTKNM